MNDIIFDALVAERDALKERIEFLEESERLYEAHNSRMVAREAKVDELKAALHEAMCIYERYTCGEGDEEDVETVNYVRTALEDLEKFDNES